MHRVAAQLRNKISQAPAATSALVSAALGVVAARRPIAHRAVQTQQIRDLIDAKAWTDAVLAIADLDRSRAIQHLVYEDGEWHCRIGSHWALPHWLGDSAEFGHPVLALAILGALIDTLGWAEEADLLPAPPLSCGEVDAIPAVSCDNYA